MILSSCYGHFYQSKSIIWHSLSIVYWGISKTVFEAFWSWPAGSIFTSEFRIKWSPNTILSCLFFRTFFSFYIFRLTISPFKLLRWQYLLRCQNFHHFFTLWWAWNNFGVVFFDLLKFAVISKTKNVVLLNFRTFPNFSKCKELEDFLISFLEIVHLKGCLGGISDNLNFRTYLRFSIFSDIGS